MTGPLKNSRHERFAQELAKGKSASEAYVLAGYKHHDGNACTLRGNQKVEARLTELLGRAAEKAAVTVADIAAQLDEDRKFARKQKHSSAAVSATMGKAKVLGLIIDQHSGPGGGPLQIDSGAEAAALKAQLAAFLAERTGPRSPDA